MKTKSIVAILMLITAVGSYAANSNKFQWVCAEAHKGSYGQKSEAFDSRKEALDAAEEHNEKYNHSASVVRYGEIY